MIRLAAVWAAVRWHAAMTPTRVDYWLRPYCWRLDDRHWRWQHRAEPSCAEETEQMLELVRRRVEYLRGEALRRLDP